MAVQENEIVCELATETRDDLMSSAHTSLPRKGFYKHRHHIAKIKKKMTNIL